MVVNPGVRFIPENFWNKYHIPNKKLISAIIKPVTAIKDKGRELKPISPFKPRSWRGALISSKSKVTFIILDEKKRSVIVSADFKEIKDIKKVEIREDRSIKLSLLFDPDHNFEKKVLKEQFSFWKK